MTRVTLPRLEFLAALVAPRLMRSFCQATECDICKANLWTVSAIALAWIRGEPKRWKTLVCNRVREMLEYTAPFQSCHCRGSKNPADILSPGLHAHDLTNSNTWWNDPVWFRNAPENWPLNIHTDQASTP
jgi:hypothetical protein